MARVTAPPESIMLPRGDLPECVTLPKSREERGVAVSPESIWPPGSGLPECVSCRGAEGGGRLVQNPSGRQGVVFQNVSAVGEPGGGGGRLVQNPCGLAEMVQWAWPAISRW